MPERFDSETNETWNREPGMVIVPGSNYAKERARFEQFPNPFGPPGNPYVYREYPRMLYRAQLYQGRIACGAVPSDPSEYPNPNEYNRQEEAARRFTEKCQRIVNNDRELQAAMEDGWRKTQAEAVAYLESRMHGKGQAAAERHYADRNMSEAAKAESKAAEITHFDKTGEQLEAIPETPVKRRPGRPRKNAPAA